MWFSSWESKHLFLEVLACDTPLAESVLRGPGHQGEVANKITGTGSLYKLTVIWVG